MEYGPDGEPNANVRFISSHISVFTPDDNSFPTGDCSLLAATPRFGYVFVACGTKIKVFQSKTLFEESSNKTVTSFDVGAQVTHIATSCDGLTLLVLILHQQVPHALFYDIISIVSKCGEEAAVVPAVSVSVGVYGSEVHGVAWNPMDANSVAVAASPSSLLLLTLGENRVDIKTQTIEARALGWSPKGKQLTVGVSDGTLHLYKPDLTPVRTINRPPMDEAGGVLSITWFTNTEFFVGYRSSVEEGAHVMMYVNAPKAKEPKFVAYEYICNYNQGPRTPMFYPFFFPEWSLLCLLSSRAVAMAVVGRCGGGEGWCEYEIDEGCVAAVHNVSITQETFPLGMAVDFTSHKTFTSKDNKVSGPCPVLLTLSTGGELNLFHMVNDTPGTDTLTKPLEALPSTPLRTPQQYGGVASYRVTLATPAAAATQPPAAASSFPTSSSTPLAFPSLHGATAMPSSSMSPFQGKESPFTTILQPPTVTSTSTTTPSPLQSLKASLSMPPTQASSPITSSLFSKTPITPFFNAQATSNTTKPIPTLPHPSTTATATAQNFRLPAAFPPPQTASSSSSSSPAMVSSVSVPDTKPQSTPLPAAAAGAVSKAPLLVMPQSVPSLPKPSLLPPPPQQPPAATVVPRELNETLLTTIETAKTCFEKELQEHLSMGELPNQVGSGEDMGALRCSLDMTSVWVDEMATTTSELKGEVGQLHSEVLEGFVLAEEAETQSIKSKNPRHHLMLQPQSLDPHSRKQMEEIRSLYQYLQNQLVEIETKLHLDWAAYRNEQNKKKKKELPASETLYQALKKCHYTRKVCERRVDAICDRIKDLHLHSLSSVASTHSHHQEDDEMLASLERSLRNTTISSSSPILTSPFKMLSPRKQEGLRQVLSQRNFIPLRKCNNTSALLNVTSLDEQLSPRQNHQASPQPTAATTTTRHSLLDSFGPQTFSTPLRVTTTTTGTTGTSKTNVALDAATPPPPPHYEDITPPHTPANTKSASPLRALSRLVSEVPTTLPSDPKHAGTVILQNTAKPPFLGTPPGTVRPAVSITVVPTPSPAPAPAPSAAAVPIQGGAFKPVTSNSLSSLSFPFPQFTPPVSSSSSSVSQQQQQQQPSILTSSSLMFKPPNVTLDNNNVIQIPSKTEIKGSSFFKSATVSGTESGPSYQKTPLISVAPSRPLTTTITTTTTTTITTDSSSSLSSSSLDSDTASITTVVGPGTQEPLQTSNKEASTPSTPSLFSVNTAGSFFGGGGGSMFSSVSSLSSGSSLFAPKTNVDSIIATPPSTSTLAKTTAVTPTVTATGLFAPPSTTAGLSGGIFSTPTASNTLFGTKTSVPTTTTPSTTDSQATTISGSIFGKALTGGSVGGVMSPTNSKFGSLQGTTTTTTSDTVPSANTPSATTNTTATPTATTSIFGLTSGSIFGTLNTTSATATATTPATLFGNSKSSSGSEVAAAATTAASNTAAGSGLGTATSAAGATGSSSLFGISAAGTASGGSIFGGKAAAGDSGSIFGSTGGGGTSIFGATTTTTTTASIFGATATTTTTSITSTSSGGFFTSSSSSSSAAAATVGSSSGSVFGSPQTTSTQSIFGNTALNSSSNTLSLFGRNTSTATATATASTTPTAAAPSLATALFSSPPSGSSPFTSKPDNATTPTPTSSSVSLFASPSTSSFSFTSPSTTSTSTSTSTSVFGQTTSGSVFGGVTQGSLFGGQTTPKFGAAPPSGSVFGGGGGGGQSTSLFGNTAATTSSSSSASVFGQTSSPATSLFSSVSTSKAESSPFGNTSVFGGGGGGGGGGGFFSGLGSKPSAENANKNVFGTGSLSSASPQTSLFGGSSSSGGGGGGGSGGFQGSVFGGGGGGGDSGNGGGGAFSSGGGGGGGPVGNTGFAVTTQQTPAFGGGATFGGSPSFGGSPTFGSPAVFGGSSTFSSPLTQSPGGGGGGGGGGGSSGFGSFASSGNTATFGSIAGSTPSPVSSAPSAGFGSFATQSNTASFGSLAQHQTEQTSGGFGMGGGNSFGSGSNFSSWR